MLRKSVLKLANSSRAELLLLVEAAVLAIASRRVVGRVAMPEARGRLAVVARRLVRFFGRDTGAAPIEDLNTAVHRVTRRGRLADTCLYRSMILDAMSTARGRRGRIQIGFRGSGRELEGHAWYRIDDIVLAEGREPRAFASFTLGEK